MYFLCFNRLLLFVKTMNFNYFNNIVSNKMIINSTGHAMVLFKRGLSEQLYKITGKI